VQSARNPAPPGDASGKVNVDAHCSVVGGQRLTSKEIKINCGLDKDGVRAVMTQAVAGFDLPKLVETARNNQLQDEGRVKDLAEKVGLDAQEIARALEQLGKERGGSAQLAEKFVDIVFQDQQMEFDAGSLRVAPAAQQTKQTVTRISDSRVVVQRVAEDARTLRAHCAAIAGGTVNAGVVDLHCGPTEGEIQRLVAEVVSQADLANLVKQGLNPDSPQIAALAQRLGVTNASVAQLLVSLAKDEVGDDQVARRFAERARKHLDLVLWASTLPDDNAAVALLREQAMAAVGQGEYKRPEALLAAAELVRRSGAPESASTAQNAGQNSSALTIAAQYDDRGRGLLQSQDYVGAAKLFAQAAAEAPNELPLVQAGYLIDQANAEKADNGDPSGKETSRNATEVYHRAFEFIVRSFADLCPGQPAPGVKEVYKALSKDHQTEWTLKCP
jgi:hypothetical protein